VLLPLPEYNFFKINCAFWISKLQVYPSFIDHFVTALIHFMILLLAIVIGLAATLIRARIKHQKLRLKPLRLEWLVFVSVIPQVLIFQVPLIGRWVPEPAIPYIQISSMLALLIFSAANIIAPGFWALGLGLLGNFLAISLNGGWMPISQETLMRMLPEQPVTRWVVGTRFGLSKDQIMSVADTNLSWLSDCFTLPQWIPYKVAFSLGDIFISIGAVILLWSLSSSYEEEEKV
jgi:hypothetical protein